MRDPIFKCAICGKFISYKEMLDKKIEHVFTADNYFYNEEDYFQHKKCSNDRERDEEAQEEKFSDLANLEGANLNDTR